MTEEAEKKSKFGFSKFTFPFKRQIESANEDLNEDNEVAPPDEDSDFEDTVIEDIGQDTRHILTFSINPGHSNEKRKILFFNLYKGRVTEYLDTGKHFYRCSQLLQVSRHDNTISIDLQCIVSKFTSVRLRSRKFLFKSSEETERFHQYLEYYMELGERFRKLYDAIDTKKKGEITPEDLIIALKKVNLPSHPDLIVKM